MRTTVPISSVVSTLFWGCRLAAELIFMDSMFDSLIWQSEILESRLQTVCHTYVLGAIVSWRRVHHVPLLLALGGKERKQERKSYTSWANQGFLFLVFCYCLESTASVHGSPVCVSLVPFQKGGNKYGIFFSVRSENSKITQISPFSVGETSTPIGTDSQLQLCMSKQSTQNRSLEPIKPSIVRYGTEPVRDSASGRTGGPVTVAGLPS